MNFDRGFTTMDSERILDNELDVRIHPADLRELHEHYRVCWPGNAPRDVFKGVFLIEDPEAPRLPRKPL